MTKHKTKLICALILLIVAVSAFSQSGGIYGNRYPKIKVTGLFQTVMWDPYGYSSESIKDVDQGYWDGYGYRTRTYAYDFSELLAGNMKGGKVEIEMANWYFGLRALFGTTTFEDEYTNRTWTYVRPAGNTEVVSNDDDISPENEYSFKDVEYFVGIKASSFSAFAGAIDFHQHLKDFTALHSHSFDNEFSFFGFGGGLGFALETDYNVTMSAEAAYYWNPSWEMPDSTDWSLEKYKGITKLAAEIEYSLSDYLFAVVGYEYRKIVGGDTAREFETVRENYSDTFTARRYDVNTDLFSNRITFGVGIVFGLR